ncbi:MAG: hypothetical protein JOS17DRAFT_582804 [Linnemannia elongata]|nr:MAG: hypothetical protein JOS17DRAFT_582804 [Linnemannia elongata]
MRRRSQRKQNQFSAPLSPLLFSLSSHSLVLPSFVLLSIQRTKEDIAMNSQTHATRNSVNAGIREPFFPHLCKKWTFDAVNRTTETERYSSLKANCQLVRYSRPAQLVPTIDDDETYGSHPHIHHSLKTQLRSLPHLIHSSCPPWVISGVHPNSFGVHGACSAARLANWRMYCPFFHSNSHSHSHATCASKLFLSCFACTGEFFLHFLVIYVHCTCELFLAFSYVLLLHIHRASTMLISSYPHILNFILPLFLCHLHTYKNNKKNPGPHSLPDRPCNLLSHRHHLITMTTDEYN